MEYNEMTMDRTQRELDSENLEAICLKCMKPVGIVREYVEIADEFGGGSAWCVKCGTCRTGVMGPCKKGTHPVRLYFESLGRWTPEGVIGKPPEYPEIIGRFQKWFAENWTMLRNKLGGLEDQGQCAR